MTQEHTFDLNIVSGRLTTPQTLQVRRGDTVILRITTDEPGIFHLHGYDLETSIEPGEVSEMVFEAYATGKYDFELHPSHGDGDHSHEGEEEGCRATLPSGVPEPQVGVVVEPSGEPGAIHVRVEVEDFVLGMVPEDSEVAGGHWHLYVDGQLKGMYMEPEAVVMVQEPGEHEVRVTLSDAAHCEYGAHAMAMVMVKTAAEDGDEEQAGEEHTQDGEGEGVVLGSLQVYPR